MATHIRGGNKNLSARYGVQVGALFGGEKWDGEGLIEVSWEAGVLYFPAFLTYYVECWPDYRV